jgi:hypothetical protein
MLKYGRVLFTGELDEIKQSYHRLTLRFRGERRQAPALDGVLSWEGRGCEWTAVASGRLDALTRAACAVGAEESPHSDGWQAIARAGLVPTEASGPRASMSASAPVGQAPFKVAGQKAVWELTNRGMSRPASPRCLK